NFNFLQGHWTVTHRRLKDRLVHANEWEVFHGRCESRPILGQGNIDDNEIDLPAGAYRAAAVRTYDPHSESWSIWWIDSRFPRHLDPPLVGKFSDGVGTFYADDSWNGRAIRVRFIWSGITAQSARWEQAFSDD